MVVVPKAVMPESSNSSNSRDLNNYLNKKIAQRCWDIAPLVADGQSEAAIQEAKEGDATRNLQFLSDFFGDSTRNV